MSTLKTKELVDKIKREIEFSKFFRHPNIIHLYEVIETKNEIILIMEYASGGELFDLLCQEIVNNKIINNIIILLYFYSLQKKKLDVYFNK